MRRWAILVAVVLAGCGGDGATDSTNLPLYTDSGVADAGSDADTCANMFDICPEDPPSAQELCSALAEAQPELSVCLQVYDEDAHAYRRDQCRCVYWDAPPVGLGCTSCDPYGHWCTCNLPD